jgi:hypothetical protein
MAYSNHQGHHVHQRGARCHILFHRPVPMSPGLFLVGPQPGSSRTLLGRVSHGRCRLRGVILGFAAVGSSATIIRLPYVWTLKEYKGEFLWRTADVAIWTTVEVGIGITAGNLGTLRPLMQRVMSFMGISSSTGRDTKDWTKRHRNGNHGYMESGGTPLEDFTAKGAIKTTVTIRGGASHDDSQWGGLSRTNSEDDIVPSTAKLHEGGILHSVQIDTSFEERVQEDRLIAGNTSPRATVAYERV